MTSTQSYVRYSPDLETIDDDEPETFQDIADTFQKMGEAVCAHEGRATRPSHAKSTAILKGDLRIDPDLPPELAQGIAGDLAEYEVLARFAQGPGEHLDDKVSTHRGLALKILGVTGPRLAEAAEDGSQDWLLEGEETGFLNKSAKAFALNLKSGVANAPKMPEAVKGVVRDVSAATQTALKAIGLPSRTLGFFGHPPRHPLADAYFSQAPIRWGDHVAKIGVYPTEATLASLPTEDPDNRHDPEAFRHAMLDHFSRQGAEFELRVQLAVEGADMPIEDASARWSEDDSPYRTIGVIRFPPQTAWSEARSAVVDERVGFNPANSLEAHRPLGSVMRARLFVYRRIQNWRRASNGVGAAQIRTLNDLPD